MSTRLYKSNFLPIGVEIFGIDLNQPLSSKVISQIKEDVTKHRIVIARNQGKVNGSKHVEISKWFGAIDNTAYSKHPASPSIDIFRVSNDPNQGCTGVGMSGWHIDGTFRKCPYAYSIYHMIATPHHGGDTLFIPLTDIIENLDPEQRKRWERIWMVSDRRENICHPLIYSHPKTGRPTLCFHQGMTTAYVRDYDVWIKNGAEADPEFLTLEEGNILKDEIQSAIDSTTVYSHNWRKEGDFIFSDNLAVGHMAGPIPSSVDEAGLRILHRITVMGDIPPNKSYDVEFPDKDNCAY